MTSRRRDSGSARGDLLAAAFLLLLVLLFFGGVLFGDDCLVTSNMSRWLPWRLEATPDEMARPSFRDDAAQTYFPRRFLSGEEMKAGRIPLWNPYVLCGAPHLADFQSCVFHPLNVLLLYWLDPLRGMGIFVAVHLFLGGLFLYLLLRRLGAGVAGSSIGGLSFLFNAYFATYLGHPVHVSTGAWIPLLLLLVHRCVGRSRGVFIPLAVAMTVLGGFPQTILYGLLVAGAFALFQWTGLGAKERGRGALRLAALAGLVVLGAGLTLFQIAPTAELGTLSERSEIPLGRILGGHMPVPAELVRLWLPDFFGNPIDENTWLAALRGPLPHPSDLGFIGYGGVLPLLLALAAPFLSRRRERWFFAGLALLSALLAFFPLLFTLFYEIVPFARASTEVHRLQFPFLLSTAVLAGLGFEGVLARAKEGPWRRTRNYVLLWFLTVPLFAGVIEWGGPKIVAHGKERLAAMEREAERGVAEPVRLPPRAMMVFAGHQEEWTKYERRGLARYAILLLAGGGALLLLRDPRRRRIAALALVATVAADGWLFARLYYTPQSKASTFADHPLLERLRDEEDPFRIARAGREYLLPSNTGLVYGIDDLQGVNALMPADLGRVFESVHPELWPDRRRVAPFTASMGDAVDRPLWSFLNVGVFLGPRVPLTRSVVEPDRFLSLNREHLAVEEVTITDRFRGAPVVARNEAVLPRAFLRHRYEVLDDREEILARITAPDFDTRGPLFLETDPGIPEGSAAVLPEDECAIVARRGGDLDLRVRSAEPGLLFLSETWYPGWEAEVDGRRAPLLRACYAFRAVPVPAGEHAVTLRYRPRSFRLGVAGSLLSLAFWLGLLLLVRRRSHLSR